MQKTIVYVPKHVKRALGRAAAARGASEAELIREALRVTPSKTTPPRPRLPLFKSGKPGLAESDCKEAQETLALLKILALGNREVEQGKTRPLAEAGRRLRARKTKARRRR